MAMKNGDQLASKEDLREAIEDFKGAAIGKDQKLMAESLTAALVVWFGLEAGLSEAKSVEVLHIIGQQNPEAIVNMKARFFEFLGKLRQ